MRRATSCSTLLSRDHVESEKEVSTNGSVGVPKGEWTDLHGKCGEQLARTVQTTNHHCSPVVAAAVNDRESSGISVRGGQARNISRN